MMKLSSSMRSKYGVWWKAGGLRHSMLENTIMFWSSPHLGGASWTMLVVEAIKSMQVTGLLYYEHSDLRSKQVSPPNHSKDQQRKSKHSVVLT